MKVHNLGNRRRVTLTKKEPTIQRLEFVKSNFSSKEDVEEALKRHNYELQDVKIIEKSDRFVAADAPISKFDGVEEIGGPEDGFLIYGGLLKAATSVKKGVANTDNDDAEGEESDAANDDADLTEGEDANDDGEDPVDPDGDSNDENEDEPAPRRAVEDPAEGQDPDEIPEPEQAGKEPVKKGVELQQTGNLTIGQRIAKFESWSVGTAPTTLTGVIEASSEKGPLGINELQSALRVGLNNIFRKADKTMDKDLDNILSEFVTVAKQLYGVWKNAPTAVAKADVLKAIFAEAEPVTKTAVLKTAEVVDTKTAKEVEALKKEVERLKKAQGQAPSFHSDDEDFESGIDDEEGYSDDSDREDPAELAKILSQRRAGVARRYHNSPR